MNQYTFKELNLAPALYRAVEKEGYEVPTPIQIAAIPPLMEGRDVIGCAQTGTGKTAAFALPILHKIATDRPRPSAKSATVLVLTPTRELAAQVGDSFKKYGKLLNLRHSLVFGGVGQWPQVQSLIRGVDVLVATPGRLLDLMKQGHLNLSAVKYFVLDEADRMLDMGFMPDIRKVIAALPDKKQSLLFSATLSREIRDIAGKLLKDPVSIEVEKASMTAANIEEKVFFVNDSDKHALLSDILKDPEISRALVFTRTKHGANKIVQKLGPKANAIHGNKSQSARMSALKDFKTGRCRVLVATDIASRGIDVSGVTHVINYDMPNEPESYVHRIGRTARAGASGTAFSFCGSGDRIYLRDIERLIKRAVPVCDDHQYHCAGIASAKVSGKAISPRNRNNPNRAKGGFAKPWERRKKRRSEKSSYMAR